jgi:hypothetical protein
MPSLLYHSIGGSQHQITKARERQNKSKRKTNIHDLTQQQAKQTKALVLATLLGTAHLANVVNRINHDAQYSQMDATTPTTPTTPLLDITTLPSTISSTSHNIWEAMPSLGPPVAEAQPLLVAGSAVQPTLQAISHMGAAFALAMRVMYPPSTKSYQKKERPQPKAYPSFVGPPPDGQGSELGVRDARLDVGANITLPERPPGPASHFLEAAEDPQAIQQKIQDIKNGNNTEFNTKLMEGINAEITAINNRNSEFHLDLLTGLENTTVKHYYDDIALTFDEKFARQKAEIEATYFHDALEKLKLEHKIISEKIKKKDATVPQKKKPSTGKKIKKLKNKLTQTIGEDIAKRALLSFLTGMEEEAKKKFQEEVAREEKIQPIEPSPQKIEATVDQMVDTYLETKDDINLSRLVPSKGGTRGMKEPEDSYFTGAKKPFLIDSKALSILEGLVQKYQDIFPPDGYLFPGKDVTDWKEAGEDQPFSNFLKMVYQSQEKLFESNVFISNEKNNLKQCSSAIRALQHHLRNDTYPENLPMGLIPPPKDLGDWQNWSEASITTLQKEKRDIDENLRRQKRILEDNFYIWKMNNMVIWQIQVNFYGKTYTAYLKGKKPSEMPSPERMEQIHKQLFKEAHRRLADLVLKREGESEWNCATGKTKQEYMEDFKKTHGDKISSAIENIHTSSEGDIPRYVGETRSRYAQRVLGLLDDETFLEIPKKSNKKLLRYIGQKYRKLKVEYHPDKTSFASNEKLVRIDWAYQYFLNKYKPLENQEALEELKKKVDAQKAILRGFFAKDDEKEQASEELRTLENNTNYRRLDELEERLKHQSFWKRIPEVGEEMRKLFDERQTRYSKEKNDWKTDGLLTKAELAVIEAELEIVSSQSTDTETTEIMQNIIEQTKRINFMLEIQWVQEEFSVFLNVMPFWVHPHEPHGLV